MHVILVISLLYAPLLSSFQPQNLASATAGEPTPPSIIFPNVHSPIVGPGVPPTVRDHLDHRLFARGSFPNEAGAQIIELRGWLRVHNTGCFNSGPLTQECINVAIPPARPWGDDPPDFSYDLELDPTWLDQNGMDINQIVRVGSLLLQTGDTDLSTSADAEIHVELMSWREGQRLGVWPDQIWNMYRDITGVDVSRPVPRPSNWNVVVHTDRFGDVLWPWDPRYPSNVDPRENPDAYFRDGDYVRIVGALVIDFPHDRVWKYPYPHIPNAHLDKNNPAFWTEIHPVDAIERIDPPRDPNGMLHKETVRCIAAVAENGDLFTERGDTTRFEARIPAPEKPDPLAQLRFIEHIDNTGNTLAHTVSKRIDVRSNYIDVSGGVQGEGNYGDYGKFKACYRVFWEPGPPQIRINSIEPDIIIAREPSNITVYAEDWYNSGTRVDGEVIIDGIGTVGRTNVPFSFTFNTNSRYVTGRVTAPGYVDAELRFPITLPPLAVRAEPSSIEIDRETPITIYAVDPKTNASIAGQVLTNEIPRSGNPWNPVILGNTNEELFHTFVATRGEPILGDVDLIGWLAVYPTVTVVAPGYSDTVVSINFTGDLPDMIDARGPRPIPGRSGPDVPEDNCPRGIGRCPIDDGMRDRPQPFDVP